MELRTSCTRAEVVAEFNRVRDGFATLSQNYTREQLLWRPGGQSWCIAECLEHVALANSAYFTNIQAALSRASASVAMDEDTFRIGGWLSALLLKSVSPEAERKLKAPKKIRPLTVDPSEAFSKLNATNDKILYFLAMNTGPDLNRVRFQNPFVPLIKFTIASGILIMAAHGRRHLLQAERIPQTSGFPWGSELRTPELGVHGLPAR